MQTQHRVYFKGAQKMDMIAAESVDLVVTSPPYPMIEMWDDVFTKQDPEIGKALKQAAAPKAFELMHAVLRPIWGEVHRVLKPGGIACINIGDATRTIGENFALFANHARILQQLLDIGFQALPLILWRKQTNAPNKFMGSGMMPPGAYVTLEHEYILIVRKGRKREFARPSDKQNRRQSAYFWEERNNWFSDVWFDLKGTTQKLKQDATRMRSGAFPFELPYRLIHMFSAYNDVVLDPFLGTGTTLVAAMACGRNCLGIEKDASFKPIIESEVAAAPAISKERLEKRLRDHEAFVQERFERAGPFKYKNSSHGFPVVTRQELELVLYRLAGIEATGNWRFNASYVPLAKDAMVQDEAFFAAAPDKKAVKKPVKKKPKPGRGHRQLDLFEST